MARHKLFTILDLKTGAYEKQPISFPTTPAFLRAWEHQVNNDRQAPAAMFPEDFAAYEIGEFDDQTGMLYPLQAHIPLGKAIEVKRRDAQQDSQNVSSIQTARSS